MDGNKLLVTKKDGSTEEMEIISLFEFKDKKYVIYKDDKENYFGAAFNDDDSLDTNLSDGEKEALNKMFDNINRGDKNA